MVLICIFFLYMGPAAGSGPSGRDRTSGGWCWGLDLASLFPSQLCGLSSHKETTQPVRFCCNNGEPPQFLCWCRRGPQLLIKSRPHNLPGGPMSLLAAEQLSVVRITT